MNLFQNHLHVAILSACAIQLILPPCCLAWSPHGCAIVVTPPPALGASSTTPRPSPFVCTTFLARLHLPVVTVQVQVALKAEKDPSMSEEQEMEVEIETEKDESEAEAEQGQTSKNQSQYGVSYIGGDPCGSKYNTDPFDVDDDYTKPGFPDDMKARIEALSKRK